jgi:exonuclease III
MSILSWNCRGLGNPRTVRELCHLVKYKKPSLVFLMETKLRKQKMEIIHSKLGFTGLLMVDCVGRSGGLALLWSNEYEVVIQNFSQRHISGMVKIMDGGEPWMFTGFYGHPNPSKRHEAWALLSHLGEGISVP